MKYRDAASFGKRQELVTMAELLRHGFDVYTTLVGGQHNVCILRLDETLLAYRDVCEFTNQQSSAKPWTAQFG